MRYFCLIFIVSVLTAMSGSSKIFGQSHEQTEGPDALFYDTDSLLIQLQSKNQRWMPFLKGKNVLTGLYVLKSGEEDRQQPHDTDEVYYIVKGKARFVAGNKTTAVEEGSILFVKANVDHRFFEITEDLVVLVFFDQ